MKTALNLRQIQILEVFASEGNMAKSARACGLRRYQFECEYWVALKLAAEEIGAEAKNHLHWLMPRGQRAICQDYLWKQMEAIIVVKLMDDPAF